jgi:hypothetical protein
VPRVFDLVEDDQEVDVRLGIRVAPGLGAEQDHLAESFAIQLAQSRGCLLGDREGVWGRRPAGDLGVRMLVGLSLRGLAIDDALVGQPLDGAARHPGVVESEPGFPKLRELEERVLEPAEGSAPADGSFEKVAGLRIPNPLDEGLHVCISLVRRDGFDGAEPSVLWMTILGAVAAREFLGVERPSLPSGGIEPPGEVV